MVRQYRSNCDDLATTAVRTDARVAVPGGTVAYTATGSGEPLVLIHGLGGTRRTWRHIIGPLAATHRVIAPDLPGHGESDAPAGDYSLGAHAAALRDMLVALGHPAATLPGAQTVVNALAEGLHRLADSRQRHTFVRTARTVIDWRGQTVSASRQRGLLGDLPVLLAWGSEDKTIPPHHHQGIACQLPDAHLVEITGADHYPHETDPAELLPAVQHFLESTTPFDYSETRSHRLLAPGPVPAIGSSR